VLLHVTSADAMTSFLARSGAKLGNFQVDSRLRREFGPLEGGIGMLKTENLVVATPGEIRESLLALAARCERVKGLHFTGHGWPGRMDLGNGMLSSISAARAFDGLDCVMAPDASIFFTSCNLGASCEGEDLMRVVALRLLAKGGAIRAATSADMVSLISRSWNLQPQVLSVKPGGSSVRWRHASECESENQVARMLTQKWIEQVHQCPGAATAPATAAIADLLSQLESRLALDDSVSLKPEMLATIQKGNFNLLFNRLIEEAGSMSDVSRLLSKTCPKALPIPLSVEEAPPENDPSDGPLSAPGE